MLERLVLKWCTAPREEGQDLAEYAMLLSLITLALVLAIVALRTPILTLFASARTALQMVNPG